MILGTSASQWAASLLTSTGGYNSTSPNSSLEKTAGPHGCMVGDIFSGQEFKEPWLDQHDPQRCPGQTHCPGWAHPSPHGPSMDALPQLTSPSAYPGVEQEQAWIVTQTLPRRRPLLPGLVVRSNYMPCRHHSHLETWRSERGCGRGTGML